jgi:hypothetical protein
VATSQSDTINLGGANLNINTGTAKGLEKAISIIAQFVIKAQQGTNKIVYGDIKKKYKNKTNNKGDVSTAMNNGLLSVVDTIASIDICNITNFLINQASGPRSFNPKVPPKSDSPLERAKYNLQVQAYNIQEKIDSYSDLYTDPNNPQIRVQLFQLISDITQSLNIISDPDLKTGLTNPILQSEFPSLSILTNFVNNAIGKFSRFTSPNQIPVAEVQKLLKLVQNVKNTCIAIQGLNSAAAALNFLDSTFDVGAQEQISKIQKLINPDKLISLLTAIFKTANSINSIARKIIGYIKTAQVIIQTILLIRLILISVDIFLKALQIPSIFTTLGAVLGFSEIQQQTIKGFINKLAQRLGQINAVLNLVVIFVGNLIIIINEILIKLRIILLNLEQCSNISEDLIDEGQKTIKGLESTKNELETFIRDYNSNKNLLDTKFGEYNIQIVTEQIVDEGINLKRRFGIALGVNGVVVAQSTPTFASLDLIIINEVKVLLVSKGLVNSDLAGADLEEIAAVLEAAQFLDGGTIDAQTLAISPTISIDLNSEESKELGLQSFVDNIKGGKALRKKMRKIIVQNNQAFVEELKNVAPNSRLSQNIGRERQQENNKIKQDQLVSLQNERADFQQKLALSKSEPEKVALANRIKEIESEIKNLENE